MEEEKKAAHQKVSVSPIKSLWKREERALLAEVIGQIFDLQHQYGKNTAQIETLVNGFAWAMQDYPISAVLDGLKKYILLKDDMPTPANIRQIIDPVKEPWTPDWAIHAMLKKLKEDHGEYALNQEEVDYMKACMEYSLGKFRDR